MSIAEEFTLPLRAAVSTDGALVLSDADDQDVLVVGVGTFTGGGFVKQRLQELADAFNAAHADPPEITPGEERAIRAFTRKEYVRRLGDQAGLAAIRGFSEGRHHMMDEQIAEGAGRVAEFFLRERGYLDGTD